MSPIRARVVQEIASLHPALTKGFSETLDRLWVEKPSGEQSGASGAESGPTEVLQIPGIFPAYPAEDDVTDPASEVTDPAVGDRKDPRAFPAIPLWLALYEAQVQHPRVPSVRAIEASGDTLHLVRPPWKGVPLSAWSVDRPIGPKVKVFEALCIVIAAAHGQGLAHRNLSPQTVQVAEDGGIWVTGWEPPLPNLPVERPAYLAPEQVEGTGTVRSDVYRLGLLLRELLWSLPPTSATETAAILAEKKNPVTLPEGTTIPAALRQLCVESLAVDPNARPADARLFFARFLAASRRL